MSSVVISDNDDDVHLTSLLLPSSLPQEVLAKTSPKLVQMEKELRLGQCQDALAQLRSHLHSRARIIKDKYINVRHQAPNTRSRGLLDRVLAKINASAERYRTAYAALLVLDSDPIAKWRSEFHPLHAKDVRSMSDTDTSDPIIGLSSNEDTMAPARGLLPGGIVPEGSRTLSWIWGGTLNDASPTPGYHECNYIRSSLGASFYLLLPPSLPYRMVQSACSERALEGGGPAPWRGDEAHTRLPRVLLKYVEHKSFPLLSGRSLEGPRHPRRY